MLRLFYDIGLLVGCGVVPGLASTGQFKQMKRAVREAASRDLPELIKLLDVKLIDPVETAAAGPTPPLGLQKISYDVGSPELGMHVTLPKDVAVYAGKDPQDLVPSAAMGTLTGGLVRAYAGVALGPIQGGIAFNVLGLGADPTTSASYHIFDADGTEHGTNSVENHLHYFGEAIKYSGDEDKGIRPNDAAEIVSGRNDGLRTIGRLVAGGAVS